MAYFENLEVEYILKKTSKNIGSVIASFDRIQAYDLVFRYFCIVFLNFIFQGKHLPDLTNLFSPNHFKKWWNYFELIYWNISKLNKKW